MSGKNRREKQKSGSETQAVRNTVFSLLTLKMKGRVHKPRNPDGF